MNRSQSRPPYPFLFGLATVGLLVACLHGNVAAGNSAAHKARLQLAEQPADAQQVAAVQQKLVAAKSQANAPNPREVVVVGRIGGVPNIWPDTHPDFPWYAGQASFFLVDAKVAEQLSAHAKRHAGGHECGFCKSQAAKNAHAVAVVNLVDERGEVLRVDARKLMGLEEDQTVIVRGKAKLLAGSMLVIDADGLYVARD